MQELIAGLPGIAIYGSSFYLGAGLSYSGNSRRSQAANIHFARQWLMQEYTHRVNGLTSPNFEMIL